MSSANVLLHPQKEIEALRLRLEEAEQTLEALRAGEVDSLVIEGPDGLRVYALQGVGNAYRVLIEAISEGALTATEEGVILYSNARFADMLGMPLQRVMGRSLYELVPARSHGCLQALLASAGEAESRAEVSLLSGAGEEVPALVSVNAIEDQGRRVLCLVATDLRAQKRNEEILRADRLARSVLEQTAEAIVICDERGCIIRASAAAVELCGTNPLLAFFDKAFPLVLSQRGPHTRDEGMAVSVLRGATLRAMPASLAHPEGDSADLLVTAAPLHDGDGRTLGCVISMVDVTEHRRAERALRRSEAALREVDRRKTRFFAVLSHELRNPLAPITNGLYVLERAAPGSEQAKRAKAVIDRQVRQLTRLVDDLLDVARVSREKMPLQRERFELGRLVHRALEDHRSMFDQGGVRLEFNACPEPLYVWADSARVTQVIGNLLVNAAKFTPRGGRARVSVSCEDERRHATVRVADDGAGMTAEILERLFEPFTQSDNTLDRSKGGLGLGLALVKALVELHGGEVEARSEGPGQGSEFVIRLPLDARSAEPERARTRSVHRSRRVLVIEDNIDAAESLRAALELNGHRVAVAYNGHEALAKARQFRPEVAICDIGLPGMDGYALAQAFRADPELKQTVLMALSGYALPEDMQRAAEAGFERHLSKPPDLEQLEQLLSEARGSGGGARSPGGPPSL
jgi:PAS domain S-box-containing protein